MVINQVFPRSTNTAICTCFRLKRGIQSEGGDANCFPKELFIWVKLLLSCEAMRDKDGKEKHFS